MRSVRQVALELLDCERVTLFLILRAKRELRGRTGTVTDEVITVKFGEGIAGHVAQTGGGLGVLFRLWGASLLLGESNGGQLC